jgi:hypothetical protein
MSIFFGSNPTNIVYNIPVDNQYTISYDITGLSADYVNFWFVFSSNSDVGQGPIVGPDGPTATDNPPRTTWVRGGGPNHAIITNNIAQTTFYYPSYNTTYIDYAGTEFTYVPSSDIRTCTLYGADAGYNIVNSICVQILKLTGTATWGLVGEFNNYGILGPDISMTETSFDSGIFTASLPYNINLPNAREFKIRINNNGDRADYGSSTWPTGNLIGYGDNIIADVLNPTYYYVITMNLNTRTYSSELYTDTPCFKSDTKILTNEGYICVQDLAKGDLIETLRNGYMAIHTIIKKEIYHNVSKERIKDQLYVLSAEKYPEIINEDLVITGGHSILVDTLSDKQIKDTAVYWKDMLYKTDDKYRLLTVINEKATSFQESGMFTIFHFALESEDDDINYGVYANGILVESCSKRLLREWI